MLGLYSHTSKHQQCIFYIVRVFSMTSGNREFRNVGNSFHIDSSGGGRMKNNLPIALCRHVMK